ncbi:MAG: phosphotransferase family protein [Dongiaceae bacterium]
MDPATARRLIAAQFPELSPRRAELLGEGSDFHAYLVDERWVFRFPKGAYGAARLRPEIALLPALAAALPLPVPDYRFVGAPTADFDRPFAGYPRLPGVPATRVTLSPGAKAAAASALGIFLACLHRQDRAAAMAAGARRGAADGRMAQLRDRALTNLAAVWATLPPRIRRRCRRFLHDRGRLPADHDGPGRLIHADLAAEHVLIDARGAITGVIDWTDMRIDDVAFDFAGLWYWQGERGLAIALRRYGGDSDPHLRQRARHIGLAKALEDIRYGCAANDPAYAAAGRRCLARMFGRAARRPPAGLLSATRSPQR